MANESEAEAPVTLRPMLDYPTVQTWMSGLQQHWGGDPATDDPERLPILEAFCHLMNRDPDQMIKETTMIKDGEKRIPVKGRTRYADAINAWQDTIEGSRLRQAKWGNTVRSFLIHNGVLLQSGVHQA